LKQSPSEALASIDLLESLQYSSQSGFHSGLHEGLHENEVIAAIRGEFAALSIAENTPPSTYHGLLHKAPNSITFLFNARFSKDLDTPASDLAVRKDVSKAEVLVEFRRLVAIKVFFRDHKGEEIGPSPLMLSVWKAAILDTQFYAALQKAVGCTLHNRPLITALWSWRSAKPGWNS
jgi:hypothetical protein